MKFVNAGIKSCQNELHYNDEHDIAALIENNILDVYQSRNIRMGDTVLDIGAGIGEFSIIASRLAGADGTVVAIEPSPDDFRTLLSNLKENGCKNMIPINIGVSDSARIVEIEFKGKKFNSKVDSLAPIMESLKVDKKRLKFMKMDVEGAETSIIPTSIEIVKSLDYLAIEMHGGSHGKIVPLLDSLGFIFERVSRKNYLMNAMKFSLRHPVQSFHILSAFSGSGEWPGAKKVLGGIEISRSDDLVVGIFKKIEG